MRRFSSVLLVLFVVIAAKAGSTGTRPAGWSEGPTAVGAAEILAPGQGTLNLPKAFAKTLTGPTLLVYFSPTCPHCQHVQPELNQLAGRLKDRVQLVGIASGHRSESEVSEFQRRFKTPYRIVRDRYGDVVRALGARSTPSAVLIEPAGKEWRIIGSWMPYRRGYDALVEMRLKPEDPWSVFEPNTFRGMDFCASCHVHEADSWALTHHAVAWRTLELQNKTTDPECTGCHVTGAGVPGGWSGLKDTGLVDVGCESCHSANGPHDGIRVDPKETCTQCHDAKHSLAFSVEKGMNALDHFRTVSMSPEQFQMAYRDLVAGRAPKPLIGFDSGQNVGSAACAECHAAQHDWWKDSPHGQKEVGCESCHGPGTAHVQAGGGKKNIEALGEDCPVCVVDALCTSCHTPDKDPSWNLDTRLKALGHP
jgi:thiol-disulfide isomerase/thioredoxin